MEKIVNRNLILLYHHASKYLSYIVGLSGLFILLIWIAITPNGLKNIIPGLVSMKPYMAWCFILISIALILLQLPTHPKWPIKRIAKILALCVFIISVTAQLEHVTGNTFYINDFIFQYFKEPSYYLYIPGRIAPISALAFTLVSIAIIILDLKNSVLLTQVIAFGAGLLGLFILVDAMYHFYLSTGLFLHAHAAILSGLNFIFIAIAVVFLRPTGVVILLSSKTIGGSMARRVFPFIALIPVIVGYIRLWGENSHLYDSETGTAVFVVVIIGFTLLTAIFICTKLMKEDIRRKQFESTVLYLADHDPLTGLDNKFIFERKSKVAIDKAQKDGRMLFVLYMGIDNFKKVNDALGHYKGDIFLDHISGRLKNILKNITPLARFSGDLFVTLLGDTFTTEEVIKTVKALLYTIAQPFSVENKEFYISISIGISVYPTDGTEIGALLKAADVAMYEAKRLGKNRYQFCSQDLVLEMQENIQLENNLHLALERNELIIYYQPIVNMQTNKMVSVEALLYWKDSEGKLLSPEQFIPIAEENNLIISIGEWVLRNACLEGKKLAKYGIESISVNVSVNQLRAGFYECVMRVLNETGFDPHALILEITESALMQEAENAAGILNSLRKLGIRIAIDDFGTGYSSFTYIKNFLVDYIKIDRSFVQDILIDKNSQVIVTAAIAMAQALEIKVVVEGIENKEQLMFFKNKHCDKYQGYFFSKPKLPEEIIKLL